MATVTQTPRARRYWNAALDVLRRTWSFLWPPTKELPAAPTDHATELTFIGRIEKFVWLSSGLFSAASVTIPAIGLFAYGISDGMSTDFLAAMVSACLFGLACLLHFGPDEA